MSKPILCLDFDGVVNSYKSGWQGVDAIPDPPTEGFFEWLATAMPHFRIVIFSSRSSSEDARKSMQGWLWMHYREWRGTDPDAPVIPIEKIEFPANKPPALITIDDRAINFTGNWTDFDPEQLLNFKPWNKR